VAAASAAGRYGAPSYRAASCPIDVPRESRRALPEADRFRDAPRHRDWEAVAGLPQAPGFALAVPTRHAVAILPIPLRQKLGIP